MRRSTYVAALVILPAILAACPDNTKKPWDAAPEAAPLPPPVDAAPLVLPLEDAGVDAAGDADADAKKVVVGVVTDAAKIRQCCNAIRGQALGAPELIAVAASCDALAAQAQAGSSPELKALKGMLGGRSVPGCNF